MLLCTVISTQMSSVCSSLDCVLSHWVHFTVLDSFVFMFVYCVFIFFSHCICAILL